MAEKIDPNARFQRLREQAKQETGAAVQARKEALARKFAQAGLTSSGAAIKQETLAEKAGQSALGRRLGQIESAQESEALRRQEVQEGREFAAGQAKLGREFQASQGELQRKFAAEQAGLGREFARGEREAGQEFSATQSAKMLELQQKFAADQADIARKIQQGQFNDQMEFAKEQFGYDQEITQFNQKMAKDEAGKKDIFSNIGQFGTDAWKGVSNVWKGGGTWI